MRFIPFFVTFLFSSLAFSQDYQMIQSNRIAYFSNVLNSFHNPVIIDSVQVINGDSILYPSPSIVPVVNGEGNYCLNPKQASWLGKAIIIKENGENTFINVDNDTLVFNTQAVLNEVWEVIRWNDSSYIEAEVTSISQESFFGQEDFVKTISFRVIGREEDFSKIENERVKISENYGLMRTFNFYYFPMFMIMKLEMKFIL